MRRSCPPSCNWPAAAVTRIVAASVIAAGSDYTNSVTLDVGSRDGVHAQETVLNGDGLVGTVTQVSKDTSTVLLATDASSVAGARWWAITRSARSPAPGSRCPGRTC